MMPANSPTSPVKTAMLVNSLKYRTPHFLIQPSANGCALHIVITSIVQKYQNIRIILIL